MAKVATTSTPQFSGMKYRVVNTLGTGAGSTILLISDKTAGGKRYALKVVRKQEPEDEVYVQQALTEFEAAKKLNHPAIVQGLRLPAQEVVVQGQGRRAADGVRRRQDARRDRGARAGPARADLRPGGVGPVAHAPPRRLSRRPEARQHHAQQDRPGEADRLRHRLGPRPGQEPHPGDAAVHRARAGHREGRSTRRPTSTTSAPRCTACSPGGSRSRGSPSRARTASSCRRSRSIPGIPGTLNEIIIASLSLDPTRRPAGMFEIRDQMSAVAKHMGLAEVDLRGADDEE